MLIKKELASIPVLDCPKLGRNKERYQMKDFYGAAKIVALPRSGDVLVVDFFDQGSRKLVLRFFSDGKNFQVCREWPAVCWYQNNPRCVLGECCSEDYEDDRKTAFEYLTPDRRSYYCGGLLGIVDVFVSIWYEHRRTRTEAKAQALMDEHFAMYPDFPKNLGSFCEDHVFRKAYIFIDALDRRKGTRRAMCSHCGKKFTLGKGIRSGQETICPKCGRKAVYRGSWVKTDVEERKKVCIAAKVDGQLLLRWTNVTRITRSNMKSEYQFDDYAYNLYLHTKVGPKIYFYKWLIGPYCYGYSWYRGRIGDVCYDSAYIYTDNLEDVFGKSYYNVNLKAGLENKDTKIAFTVLLNSLKNYPAAEYLFKLGMVNLAAHAKYLNDNCTGSGSGFSRTLGISKQLLPMYMEMNPTPLEHSVIREYGKWVSKEDLELYRSLNIESTDVVLGLLKSMSYQKLVRYFTKQKALHPKMRSVRIMENYRDYIDMSIGLAVDLRHKSVRFPSDCIEAHNRILSRFNQVKHEAEDRLFAEKVKGIYAAMRCTEFDKDGLCIVLPQKRSDLITEGQSLNHCVGGHGYYERHIAGTRMIFFVRKADAPNVPYFTLEIDMKTYKIGQLYGFGDCSAPKKVRAFAEKFARRLAPTRERRTA